MVRAQNAALQRRTKWYWCFLGQGVAFKLSLERFVKKKVRLEGSKAIVNCTKAIVRFS